MSRSVSLPRRLCAALLLFTFLFLPGCTDDSSVVRTHLTYSAGDDLPTELHVGIVADEGLFPYGPLFDTLPALLPEGCAMSLTAATAEDHYLTWSAEELAASSFQDLSDAIADAPVGTADPVALVEHMLAALPEHTEGSRPLLLILSPDAAQYNWGRAEAQAFNAGGMLKVCPVKLDHAAPDSMYRNMADLLSMLTDALRMQVVPLTADETQRAAFTLPELGAPSLILLVRNSEEPTLHYKDSTVGLTDTHRFKFKEGGFFSSQRYDAPKPGDYVLEMSGDAPAALLCFRHALVPELYLAPTEGRYVTANKPMRLEVNLTQHGDTLALPKDLTAACLMTVGNDKPTELPLTAEKEHFYERSPHLLVSAPFSITQDSTYAPLLILNYPQLGALRFSPTAIRNTKFMMDNAPPHLRSGSSLSWAWNKTRTFTPEELFEDPEGDKITLLPPSSKGGISAVLDQDGSLLLTAQKHLNADGTITLRATDDQGNDYSVSTSASYVLLPIWALLIAFFVLCGLIALIVSLIDAIIEKRRQRRRKRISRKRRQTHAQKAQAKREAKQAAREAAEEARKRAEAEAQAERERIAAAAKADLERAAAAAEAERERARAEQEHIEAEKRLNEERAQAEERLRKRHEIERMLARLEQKQQTLLGMRTQLTEDIGQLRRDLEIHRWMQDELDPEQGELPLAAAYLTTHPGIRSAYLLFQPEDAEKLIALFEDYHAVLDSALPPRRSGESPEPENAEARLAAMEAAEARIPKDFHQAFEQFRLAENVRETYEKFHGKADDLPAMPIVIKAGNLYLGYTGGRSGVLCRLGDTVLHGLPGEPAQRLDAIVPAAEELYLLPARQGALLGYEVITNRAVFRELNSTSSQPCTFLLPGKDYRLIDTAVVVSIKLPIR